MAEEIKARVCRIKMIRLKEEILPDKIDRCTLLALEMKERGDPIKRKLGMELLELADTAKDALTEAGLTMEDLEKIEKALDEMLKG